MVFIQNLINAVSEAYCSLFGKKRS